MCPPSDPWAAYIVDVGGRMWVVQCREAVLLNLHLVEASLGGMKGRRQPDLTIAARLVCTRN